MLPPASRASRALRALPAALGVACLLACAGAPPTAAAPLLPARCAPPEPGAQDDVSLIMRFYAAFARRDFPAMACCYAPDVEFTDSIFGTLRGKRALAMWAMLTAQARDFRLQYSNVRVEGARARAHWDAQYTVPFLAFDNAVRNEVEATFEVRGGTIVRHRDVFDLDRWMHQALWPLGGVVGEGTIRARVNAQLDDFVAKHPEFQEPAAAR